MYWKFVPSNSGCTEILKNPSPYEISKISKGVPGVRAILLDKTDLYVWEYDSATHDEIVRHLKGKHKLNLVICCKDGFISFQRSIFSSIDEIEIYSDEFVKIPCIAELITNKTVFFFAFPKSKVE
jgi:hypothetical protein